jgi:hypothetical protein
MASVLTDLMMAMSSTTLPVCGSSSLSQVPFLPYCWNLNSDGATGNRAWPEVMVVIRCPLRTDSGRSLSNISCIFGL